MNELTLEAIIKNPKNVLTCARPIDPPPRHTLIAAQIAATCLRQIAAETWDACYFLDDACAKRTAEEALEILSASHPKTCEIIGALENYNNAPPFDYWLPLPYDKKIPSGFVRFIETIFVRNL